MFYRFFVVQEALASFISRRVIRGGHLFLDLDSPEMIDLVVTCAGWVDCRICHQATRLSAPCAGILPVALGAGYERQEMDYGARYVFLATAPGSPTPWRR